MRNLIIILILLMFSISNSQKVWEEEGWELTAENLHHKGANNKSKSDLTKLFEQYLEKASNLKELTELKNNYSKNPVVWYKDVLLLFKNLININKVKELDEIGIDLNKYGNTTIQSNAVFSQIIFTGVVKEDIETDKRFRYFKVKILEILKGDPFIKKKHDYYNMHYTFSEDKRDMYYYHGRKPIEINGHYIFLIKNINFISAKFNSKNTTNDFYRFPLDDFSTTYFLIDPHQSPDSVKFNDLIRYHIPDRPSFIIHRDVIYNNELDTLKQFLNKYEEINDTPNFFDRSYE